MLNETDTLPDGLLEAKTTDLLELLGALGDRAEAEQHRIAGVGQQRHVCRHGQVIAQHGEGEERLEARGAQLGVFGAERIYVGGAGGGGGRNVCHLYALILKTHWNKLESFEIVCKLNHII